MPRTAPVYIYGISDFGNFTGAFGGPYVETSWGKVRAEGAVLRPTLATIDLRSGNSASIVDSFVSEFGATVEVGILSGTLENLRKLQGLPAGALTGDLSASPTPTKEVLQVRGDQLATVEFGLYMRTMGPLGPRTYYVPRAKVASLPDIAHGRTGYFIPGATFNALEDTAGRLYWVEDAVA